METGDAAKLARLCPGRNPAFSPDKASSAAGKSRVSPLPFFDLLSLACLETGDAAKLQVWHSG
ncbi:Uncharacterized protein dnm_016190 [Desulfonema magnum]|uniref:Uncharacterized protein n=1 Tax=Desulfonema magnum TaxID=45655 RepID=A0A975BHV2_9BACT|nr:Uncharacterized protein dnm_016190 [Desulfonema magnum]